MMQTQSNSLPANALLEKAAQQDILWNSQGERIDAPSQSAPASVEVQGQQQAPLECSYEDISLDDTPLVGPLDMFYPPTDDSGLVHAVISCGHVLKSTHDLARWSEKTGARRVNGQEALDAVSDLLINFQDPRAAQQADLSTKLEGTNTGRNNLRDGRRARNGGAGKQRSTQPSQIISSGPVLKSTHDLATRSEKSGPKAVNFAESVGLFDEVAGSAKGRNQSGQRRAPRKFNAPRQPSQVIKSWPVLKSTHDAATWSEKKGANAVNSAGSVGALGVAGQGVRGVQAGGASGSSLQSGHDTQAGSHVQLDGSKAKETPEKVMEALHVHV